MKLEFRKLSKEDILKVRSELPPRGFKIGKESVYIRETLLHIQIGEASDIDISKGWNKARDKNTTLTKILSQIQWVNKNMLIKNSRLVPYFTPDKNKLIVEHITEDIYTSFKSKKGRFNTVSFRLGKVSDNNKKKKI